MRTVLDEGSVQGRLSLAHIHRQQEPAAKLQSSKEAHRHLQWSGQHEDLISRFQEQRRRSHSDRLEPDMIDRRQHYEDGHDRTNGSSNHHHHQPVQPESLRATSPLQQQLPNGAVQRCLQEDKSQLQLDSQQNQQDKPHDQTSRPRVGHFQAVSVKFQAHCNEPNPLSNQIPAKPPPRILPNNTLVEDVGQCHSNLWPKATRATSKSIELIKSCVPTTRQAATTTTTTTGQISNPKVNPQNGFTVDLERQQQDFRPTSTINHQVQSVKLTKSEIEKQPIKRKSQLSRTRSREYKFPMPPAVVKLNSTLTQDDYERALCVLGNDIRFQLHILLYGQLQTVWLLFSTLLCFILPILLNFTLDTTVISSLCSLWLLLQALGLLIVGRCRKKLDRMLERSVAQVNSYFMDHKLMLGVINSAGPFRKSRLAIPLIYFNTFECIEQIESIVSVDLKLIEANGKCGDDKQKRLQQQQVALDYSKIGFNRMDPNQRAFAKSQLAKKIVLRFGQRWISHYDKNKLMFIDEKTKPRHLSTGKCLCQFIEEHFKGDPTDTLDDLDEPIGDCCDRSDQEDATTSTSTPTTRSQQLNLPNQRHCNLEVYEILSQLAMRQLITGDCEKSHTGLAKREILRALANFAAENLPAPLGEKTIGHHHHMLVPHSRLSLVKDATAAED